MNDINANRKPTPKFWRRFTAISGLPSGVSASPMTQVDSMHLKLELPPNNLEIFVIGHVVASLSTWYMVVKIVAVASSWNIERDSEGVMSS